MNLAEFERELERVEKLSKGANVKLSVEGDTVRFVGEIRRRNYPASAAKSSAGTKKPKKDVTIKKVTPKPPRQARKGGSLKLGYHTDDPRLWDSKKGRVARTSKSGAFTILKKNPIIELNLSDIKISDKDLEEKLKLLTNERQVGYLPPVKLMQIGSSQHYELVEDYAYDVDHFAIKRKVDLSKLKATKKGVPPVATITAKAGFQFDRSSIPRLFWAIISKDDLSNVPPLFHDLLYRFAGKLPDDYVDPYTTFTRMEADSLFLHLMKQSGVKGWRASFAYAAVKWAGDSAWQDK